MSPDGAPVSVVYSQSGAAALLGLGCGAGRQGQRRAEPARDDRGEPGRAATCAGGCGGWA